VTNNDISNSYEIQHLQGSFRPEAINHVPVSEKPFTLPFLSLAHLWLPRSMALKRFL
jgi:hypothetical protein